MAFWDQNETGYTSFKNHYESDWILGCICGSLCTHCAPNTTNYNTDALFLSKKNNILGLISWLVFKVLFSHGVHALPLHTSPFLSISQPQMRFLSWYNIIFIALFSVEGPCFGLTLHFERRRCQHTRSLWLNPVSEKGKALTERSGSLV